MSEIPYTDFAPISFDVKCADINTTSATAVPDVAPFSCDFPSGTDYVAEDARNATAGTTYMATEDYRVKCEIPCQAKKDCNALCTCNDGDGCASDEARLTLLRLHAPPLPVFALRQLPAAGSDPPLAPHPSFPPDRAHRSAFALSA
jgi:hypothetical protein